MRKEISTNSQSENEVGYSRAVVVNDEIHFSGTISTEEDGKIVGTNVYEQSVFIFDRMGKVLNEAGFELREVVGVEVLVYRWLETKDFDRAFKERFEGVCRPTCTMSGVVHLVHDEALIEISYWAKKTLKL